MNLFNELIKEIPKEQIFLNEPMKKRSTFKIGGPADFFIKVKNIQELKCILKITHENNVPLYVIGNGSNILFSDKGIDGIVIKLQFNEINIKDEEIEVGAGVQLAKLASYALDNSLSGLEELSGIPGTIAGAVKMNAGAYGREMKDIVVSTTYMDKLGNIFEINNKEHRFEYRKSIFNSNEFIILKTVIKLQRGDKKQIKEKIENLKKQRKEKQPLEYPNAGSTFKRGEDFITARLIDECGLKGYSIGDAEVSEKHAGFIINKGNATAEDVINLIEHIKKEVYNKFGKKIELEIEIIGRT